MAKEGEEQERREKSVVGKGSLRVSVSFKGEEGDAACQDSARREVFHSARSRFETPDQERACLYRVFTAFDENGDGKLSVLEIHRSLTKLGIYLPLEDLQSTIACSLSKGTLPEEDDTGPLHLMEDDSPLPKEFHTPLPSEEYRPLPKEEDRTLPKEFHTPLPREEYRPLPKEEDRTLPKEDHSPLPMLIHTTLHKKDDTSLPKEVRTTVPNEVDDATLDFNGFRDLYQFLSCNESLLTPSTLKREEEADLHAAFGIFDQDKDGFITANELQLVLHNLGFQEGQDLSKCKEFIDRVDVDKDGRVNFAEFQAMINEFHNPHLI